MPRSLRDLASITIRVRHNILVARALMTIGLDLDRFLQENEEQTWVSDLNLKAMEVMLDTRIIMDVCGHPPEKTMDWILHWLEMNHRRKSAPLEQLCRDRDVLLNLFPIDRVDLFWLFDLLRERSLKVPFRRFNKEISPLDPEDPVQARVKRHDDEQPQNWLSTSRVVIEWVRRAIQTAAMRFPVLDDSIGVEFQVQDLFEPFC